MAFDKEMAKNGDTPAEPAHRIAAVGARPKSRFAAKYKRGSISSSPGES